MLKRRSIARIARLLVGSLAFAQAALAWSACDWLDRAPQRAIAQHQSQPVEGNCHHAAVPTTNLCLMHCTNDQQCPDKPSVQLPALDDAAVLFVYDPLAVMARVGAIRHNVAPFAGAPPPRIMFGAMRA